MLMMRRLLFTTFLTFLVLASGPAQARVRPLVSPPNDATPVRPYALVNRHLSIK